MKASFSYRHRRRAARGDAPSGGGSRHSKLERFRSDCEDGARPCTRGLLCRGAQGDYLDKPLLPCVPMTMTSASTCSACPFMMLTVWLNTIALSAVRFLQRRAFVHCDVVGLVALDFILRVFLARVVGISF